MTISAETAAKKTRAAAYTIRENQRLKREREHPAQYESCWEATAQELDEVAEFLESIDKKGN